MHLFIDADGSPSGYIAWYNHCTRSKLIRSIRPALKNDRFGVQRMEMLAIYFAIADNFIHFENILRDTAVRTKIIIGIRSDSKSTVEQLKNICEIRDKILFRIYQRISELLRKISSSSYKIIFGYVERTNNMAGLLLEQRTAMKRIERLLPLSFPEQWRNQNPNYLEGMPTWTLLK
jgi:hypothetical protein